MHVIAKVTADASNDSITEDKKDVFTVFVKDKARQNMANNKVRALVARHYGIGEGAVRIVSGHYHTSKVLEIIM